jgi:pyruvate/2-oxoglutarate dehydrogenase complex dihydrolipoamide dehydrogenase (E3) component
VKLRTEANTETVLALKPEVVLVATGSRPRRLEIPGGAASLSVHEAVSGAADAFKRVLVFDREGFSRPLVAADYLSSRGIQVDLVSSQLDIGSGLPEDSLEEIFGQLKARGVRFWPGFEMAGWQAGGRIQVRDVQTGEEKIFEQVEAVVATVGSDPVNALARELEGKVPELHVIGDANLPQNLEIAVYQGALIGRKL